MAALTLRFSSIAFGLCAGFAIQSACTTHVTNDAHCFYHEGNSTCVARYGDDLPYCGTVCLGKDGNPSSPNGDGCVDFVPEDGCYSPCGGEEDVTENDMCSVADTGTSEPTSATEPTATSVTMTDATTADSTGMTASSSVDSSTTAAVECNDSSECDDAHLPICDPNTNECTSCSTLASPDDACFAKDPLQPVCGNDGACVQCTPSNADACESITPICDEATNSCIGCTFHEQCSSGACRFATGECFAEAQVHDVGAGQEYATIGAAVSDLGEGVLVVLVLHAGADFNQGVTLSGAGTAYAFISEDEPAPLWIRSSGMGATLTVSSDAEAYVNNVRFTGNLYSGSPAIEADGASVWLDKTEVVNNVGGGLGVSASGYVRLRNSIVGGNGGGAPATRGVTVNASTVDVIYSTLARNDASADDSLTCTGASTVSVRNSILVGRDAASVNCTGIDATYTAVDEALAGTGNANVGPMDNEWFTDVFSNDFRLSAAGGNVFEDLARWQNGDPPTDIEADMRPSTDGTMDYAGADRP